MIEKILARLEVYLERDRTKMAESENEDAVGYYYARVTALNDAKDIVQEVAKEHGRKLNRCDTCTHYIADKVPPICYFCSKGMEDNYKEREGE